jgi:hypothetical protein
MQASAKILKVGSRHTVDAVLAFFKAFFRGLRGEETLENSQQREKM